MTPEQEKARAEEVAAMFVHRWPQLDTAANRIALAMAYTMGQRDAVIDRMREMSETPAAVEFPIRGAA